MAKLRLSSFSIFLMVVLVMAKAEEHPNLEVKSGISIITRKDWGAKDPFLKMREHNPILITIHHTGTKAKPGRSIKDKMKNLQAFSQSESVLDYGKKKPAWADVPYHFYIAIDGNVAEGRRVKYAGDTNTAYDPTGHIQVVLEGNFMLEKPTVEQIDALISLVYYLKNEYGIKSEAVKSHRDYASTECPGKFLVEELLKRTESFLELLYYFLL